MIGATTSGKSRTSNGLLFVAEMFWELVVAAGGGPLGFDFYWAFCAGGVVVEAGPLPIFWFGDEAAGDGVAVDVAEFFCAFFRVVYEEVIEPCLPEGPLFAAQGD